MLTVSFLSALGVILEPLYDSGSDIAIGSGLQKDIGSEIH